MTEISRSSLLPYSAQQLYDLVNDVASYPEFLSTCVDTQVLEEGEGFMVASMTVSIVGRKFKITSRNEQQPGKEIDLIFLDGPFRRFSGKWVFTDLGSGSEPGCKVSLMCRFQVKSGLFNVAIGPALGKAADIVVADFSSRARQLYGGTTD